VRDVRLYAEQQLALILQRMSVSHGHQAIVTSVVFCGLLLTR
jgi:hypothetical protein